MLTLDLFIDLGLFSVRTFTALIGAAAAVGLAALIGSALRRRETHPLHWLDAGLGGLFGGVVGARLFHVLLNMAYFRDHTGEAFNLRAGGLNWHGAFYGALLGLWLAARWRRVPFRPLTDALTLALPVGVMAGWAGCLASACGFGAEVWTLADFPAWVVSEQADIFGVVVPRYNVQQFGIWLGAGLLVVAALIMLPQRLAGYRLWLVSALTGAGIFVLGFFRGDGAASFLPNLTSDQVLDMSVFAFSVLMTTALVLDTVRNRRRRAVSESEPVATDQEGRSS